jgi:hypothetical protein
METLGVSSMRCFYHSDASTCCSVENDFLAKVVPCSLAAYNIAIELSKQASKKDALVSENKRRG